MAVRYTKEEMEAIKKFLADALDYEKKSRKHWIKEAAKKEDEEAFMHLATQAQARVEAIVNYQQQVGSSAEFIESHQYETGAIFIS